MRFSRPKPQFMDLKFGHDNGQEKEPVNIPREELQRMHLGSSVDETVGMVTSITQR